MDKISQIKAYVLIKTKPGTAKTTVERVKEIDGVKDADSLWGAYDAIAVIDASDLNELDEIVCHRIKLIESVADTMTMICKNLSVPDAP